MIQKESQLIYWNVKNVFQEKKKENYILTMGQRDRSDILMLIYLTVNLFS